MCGNERLKLVSFSDRFCRFPAQERSGGDAKIPTVIYYDRDGTVRATGAEVLLESNIDMAIEQQWVKVEW